MKDQDYSKEPYTGWSEEMIEVTRNEKAHSILFSTHDLSYHGRIEVPIEDVWDFVDSEPHMVKAEWVVWEDGTGSYAGSKWFPHNHPTLWNRMTFIGAGAYPDYPVLSRKGIIKRNIWGTPLKEQSA